MSVPKYKLVVNAKDGENGIEIVEGKYDGVIYTYGEVQFTEVKKTNHQQLILLEQFVNVQTQ